MNAAIANFDTRPSLALFEDSLCQTLMRDNPLCPTDCISDAVRVGMHEYRWSRKNDRAKAALDAAQDALNRELELRMKPYNPPPRAA